MNKDEIPPINTSWSLTAYNENDFLVNNPNATVPIYSVGSRGGLNFNDDGSLEILVKYEAPDDPNANWLPSPESGKMSLTLRLYGPTNDAFGGNRKPSWVEVNSPSR